DENPFTVSRVGVIYFIGSTSVVTLTVTQNEAPCSYTISPTNTLNNFTTETGLVQVATSSNCSWGLTNTNSWITILAPTNLVSGTGVVSYVVAPNTNGALRSGNIIIAGKRLTVRQSGVPCNYLVSPTNASNL